MAICSLEKVVVLCYLLTVHAVKNHNLSIAKITFKDKHGRIENHIGSKTMSMFPENVQQF